MNQVFEIARYYSKRSFSPGLRPSLMEHMVELSQNRVKTVPIPDNNEPLSQIQLRDIRLKISVLQAQLAHSARTSENSQNSPVGFNRINPTTMMSNYPDDFIPLQSSETTDSESDAGDDYPAVGDELKFNHVD